MLHGRVSWPWPVQDRTGQDRMRWPRRRAFAATPSVGLRACNAALRSELAVGRRISRWYWSRSGSGCSWTLLLLLPLYDARQSTEARPLPVRYVPRCVQRVAYTRHLYVSSFKPNGGRVLDAFVTTCHFVLHRVKLLARLTLWCHGIREIAFLGNFVLEIERRVSLFRVKYMAHGKNWLKRTRHLRGTVQLIVLLQPSLCFVIIKLSRQTLKIIRHRIWIYA